MPWKEIWLRPGALLRGKRGDPRGWRHSSAGVLLTRCGRLVAATMVSEHRGKRVRRTRTTNAAARKDADETMNHLLRQSQRSRENEKQRARTHQRRRRRNAKVAH